MGKPKKKSRKNTFDYNKTRKRRMRRKEKKLPTISCEQIKQAWDVEKSVQQNMLDMGLSTDPNKTLRIPTVKELMSQKMPGEEKMELTPHQPSKKHVVEALEIEANRPRPFTARQSEPDVQFCVYMMDKYGGDYKAMARDYKNYYQDTPKQIRKKINRFKSIPEQYNAYLKSKQGLLWWCTWPPSTPLRHTQVSMVSSSRRVTRLYEAARRNGHYATPPTKNSLDQPTDSRAIFKVRRRLSFGRKPPKTREPSSREISIGRVTRRSKRPIPRKQEVARRKAAKTPGLHLKGLKRELKYLLDPAHCRLLPVRLRSSRPGSARARGDNSAVGMPNSSGYKLRRSHENTRVNFPKNSNGSQSLQNRRKANSSGSSRDSRQKMQ